MRIYGLDFTGDPQKRKPITCAVCSIQGGILHLESFKPMYCFREFEDLLDSTGPWISGVDFPFGQPWKFISGLGLSTSWTRYVISLQQNGKCAFEKTIEDYQKIREKGDKEHLRMTDALADSRSPMKLYGIPVGKMFFQGAPRLRQANVSVIPCRELKSANRVVVEAYPALVARRFCGYTPYKNDNPKKQTKEQSEARQGIVEGIGGDIRGEFGFGLTFGKEHAQEMIRDAGGDALDAVLCAIQAVWAYSMRKNKSKRYGVPAADHPVIQSEGWIVDPVMVQGAKR